jgi:diadenosine tetraphosphate (Ap4A) HIT family hydrolase
MLDCCLCSQIQGRSENDLIARLLPEAPYVRRVCVETANFAVIPSLGPLTLGHVVLCPKEHSISFVQLGPELDREYLEVSRLLTERLKAVFSSELIAFEHGMSADDRRIPCSVEHAHQHFLPVPPGSESEFDWTSWREFDGTLAALRTVTGGREYILARDTAGACRVLQTREAGFESQHMRRVFASRFGCPDWNWREVPNAHAAHATWQRLAPAADARIAAEEP